MITLGVDLAAQPEKTAACVIEWRDKEAKVIKTRLAVDDDDLLKLIAQADKVGLDVPFGWPDAFVQGVCAHHASPSSKCHGWPAKVLPRAAYYRATDLFVIARTKCRPLSVSADRIAVPTMRVARLFGRLSRRGETVRRDGKGKLVEVYPAAALCIWGLTWKGYKGSKNQGILNKLATKLISQTVGWLEVPTTAQQLLQKTDHLFDALVAALIARAAAIGECEDIPSVNVRNAKREGWIAVPKEGSLEILSKGPVR